MRWLWALLAIGSWVACAVLAEAKTASSVILFISALGWFFIAIAIGGWKGLPFGIVALVFVGCASAVWRFIIHAPALLGTKSLGIYLDWEKTKLWLDTLQDKPLAIIAIYVGLIIVLLGIIAIPVAVGRRVWGDERGTKEKKAAEKKKARIRVRGRLGVG